MVRFSGSYTSPSWQGLMEVVVVEDDDGIIIGLLGQEVDVMKMELLLKKYSSTMFNLVGRVMMEIGLDTNFIGKKYV